MIPVAKGRARFNRVSGRTYTPAKTRKAEQDMRYFLSQQWDQEPLDCPISIDVTFYFVRPKSVKASKRPRHIVKPDASNLLKALEDSGSQIIWRDDAQIDHVYITKAYDVQPRIVLLVSDE